MATELTEATEATELPLREYADERDAPLVFENAKRPRSLRRIVIATEGLVEQYGSKTLTTPWDEVYGVTWQPDRVLVKLAGRTVSFDARFGDWRRLGQEVESRAYWLQPSARHTEIGPDELAGWLGIAPGGTLNCDLGKRRLWGWAIILLFVLIAVGSAAGGSGGNVGSFVYLLGLGIALLVSADHIRADAQGITLRVKGKPRTYAWAEIQSISGNGNQWVVTTDDGKFSIASSMRNVQGLVKALQHVAAARSAGAELPDERPVSETALSRPGAPVVAEDGLERGLSRPDS